MDFQEKKITPIVDDQVFNELLLDKNNKISKLIISDNGQGILPYEGNCGFLAMSQFLVGHPQEYYCFRIFFSYLFKSLSLLPDNHPIICNDNKLNYEKCTTFRKK